MGSFSASHLEHQLHVGYTAFQCASVNRKSGSKEELCLFLPGWVIREASKSLDSTSPYWHLKLFSLVLFNFCFISFYKH